MPNYRRARTPGGTCFFTVVTYQRQPILCLEQSIEAIDNILKDVIKTYPFEINAWVTLPDHIHCLWTLPEGDSDYSIRWALIKKGFTKRMKGLSQIKAVQTPSRERRREGVIWQRRFWEHQIRDEDDYNAHMDYIHYNPVKHGLVKNPIDWRHSSFGKYVDIGWYEESWGCGDLVLAKEIGHE